MRYYFIYEVPLLEYKHIMHAHSHTALLGWAFMLLAGAYLFFFGFNARRKRIYRNLFLLNSVSVTGMAISFLYQGYGAISISFSALHLITGYIFGYHYHRETKGDQSVSARLARWSIYWYFASSLGLLALGPVSHFLGKTSTLYYGSVQFFLHFQFNGWLTYGALAVLFRFLANQGYEVKISNRVFLLLHFSLLLTYALSITFSTPLDWLFYLNALGVIAQFIAFFLLFRHLIRGMKRIGANWNFLVWLGLASIAGKVIVQMAVVIPSVAVISYTIRNYVIAFVHLITLGSITFSIAGVLLEKRLLPINKRAMAGWGVLGIGFILTEILLFGQGTMLWMKMGFIGKYHEILFFLTVLLPAGLILIIWSFRGSQSKWIGNTEPVLRY